MLMRKISMQFVKYICLMTLAVNFSYAQHEVILEDIDQDGDAVVEIKNNRASSLDAQQMIFGVNQSSGGFLRTTSYDDLSFWTHNERRLTISKNGMVGIGTDAPEANLHIMNGNLRIDTRTNILNHSSASYLFLDNGSVKGGLSYTLQNLQSQNTDERTSIFCNGDCSTSLSTNDVQRVYGNNSGNVVIPSLTTDQATDLVVDQNGDLGLVEEESTEQYMMLGANQWTMLNGCQRNDSKNFAYATDCAFLQRKGFFMAPSFPANRVRIREIIIFYKDDALLTNIEFCLKPSGSEICLKSSGSSKDVRSITFNSVFTVDQSDSDFLELRVFDTDSDKKAILGTRIKYEIL